MIFDYVAYLVLALLIVGFLAAAIRVLREYERGVVFTLGRFTGSSRLSSTRRPSCSLSRLAR